MLFSMYYNLNEMVKIIHFTSSDLCNFLLSARATNFLIQKLNVCIITVDNFIYYSFDQSYVYGLKSF